MRLTKIFLTVAAGVSGALTAHAAEWHIAGNFVESCTCGVPCNCNFGEAPSPYSFCYALFSVDIKEGHYNDVNLNGLRLAGGGGEKGMVWYIDERADDKQFAALKGIADAMYAKAVKANGIKRAQDIPQFLRVFGYRKAKIDQVNGDKQASLKIGDKGGFVADYIMGIDGKSPVRVLNNWSWNMADGWKAKSRNLDYRDSFGNKYAYKARNSNIGTVDWSDKTPVYFR